MKGILMFAILLADLTFAQPVSSDDGLPDGGAGSTQVAERPLLESFKILERSETSQKIQFRDDPQLTISKEKFSSIKQAEEFCTERKLHLHKNGIAVAFLVAISNPDEELKSAISFKISFREEILEGIWACKLRYN
jgi:hypothetical protein